MSVTVETLYRYVYIGKGFSLCVWFVEALRARQEHLTRMAMARVLPNTTPGRRSRKITFKVVKRDIIKAR